MTSAAPLQSLDECVQWVLSGCKTPDRFRIGSEYERIAVGPDGWPIPYEGPASILALFSGLQARGWRPYSENGRPIALFRDGASISLEPAGQFEMSGAPHRTIAEMRTELADHMAELHSIAEPLGIRLCHVGLNPLQPVADVPKMPKGRYGVMRAYMPTVGTLGLDMMHLTCTVQANLDFSSDSDAMALLRLGFLMGPVTIALFANSPWRHGRDSGWKSFRAHIWTDVDNARCDARRFAYDPHATVADYVNWVLDVPMYFLDAPNPDGSHGYQQLAAPTTFRQFFERGVDGRRPTLDDWELHASTVFPDVRLKRYVEIRQADCVPQNALAALPALCKGLCYDLQARGEALDLLRDGDARVDRPAVREVACRDALDGHIGDVQLRDWARELLAIARRGLNRLALATREDADAATALDVLDAVVTGARPPFWRDVQRKAGDATNLAAFADDWT
jgi:glutamate--cysteine ligase